MADKKISKSHDNQPLDDRPDDYIRYMQNYLMHLERAIKQLPLDSILAAAQCLISARDAGQRIFIVGNGGSAATAIHMVNDLNKLTISPHKKRFKAISLVENISLITAWANDSDYAQAFVEQLSNFLEAGDVVIAISTSGNSMNVVNTLAYALENGGKTILVGGQNGGKCNEHASISILVPSSSQSIQEDLHMIIHHMLVTCIRDEAYIATDDLS